MTIKIPNANLADKLLKLMGKKRGIILPSGIYEKFGLYTYSVAKKENFFIALLRSASEPLPNGVVDIHTFASLKHLSDKE